MVSVSCFGVRVSVMFHLMFVHYTFSSVWVAEFIFIYFPFGFKSGICLLIAPLPVHCFSITFFLRNIIHIILFALGVKRC